MFVHNKYTIWYLELISTRLMLDRIKGADVYYENHHIIPKSLGGKNDKHNMILLTAKEHYIAHLLLTEMCLSDNDSRKMKYALQKMMFNPHTLHKYNSSQYELARIKNLKGLLGRKFSEEHKKKIALSNLGQKRSLETRKKISDHAKTRIGSKNPFYGKTHSIETKEKSRLTKQKNKKRWITNGIDNKFFPVSAEIPSGWQPGRIINY